MKLSYDKATDTLYLFAGDQNGTVARDVGNGMLVKYDKSNRPVGVIVHNFEQRFKTEEQGTLEIPIFA